MASQELSKNRWGWTRRPVADGAVFVIYKPSDKRRRPRRANLYLPEGWVEESGFNRFLVSANEGVVSISGAGDREGSELVEGHISALPLVRALKLTKNPGIHLLAYVSHTGSSLTLKYEDYKHTPPKPQQKKRVADIGRLQRPLAEPRKNASTGQEGPSLPFDRLLKAEEVGLVLGVSRSRAYALMSSGHLPVIRIGKSVRVSQRQFERWIAGQSEKETQS